MKARTRGVSLGSTLLVVVLVASLGLVLASSSVTHLQLMSQYSRSLRAQEFARSAAALGMERILRDRDLPNFGADRAIGETLKYGSESEGGCLTWTTAQRSLNPPIIC